MTGQKYDDRGEDQRQCQDRESIRSAVCRIPERRGPSPCISSSPRMKRRRSGASSSDWPRRLLKAPKSTGSRRIAVMTSPTLHFGNVGGATGDDRVDANAGLRPGSTSFAETAAARKRRNSKRVMARLKWRQTDMTAQVSASPSARDDIRDRYSGGRRWRKRYKRRKAAPAGRGASIHP